MWVIKEQMNDSLWGARKFLSLLYGNIGVYEVMEDSRMKCGQTFSFFLQSSLRASNGLMEQSQFVNGLALVQQIPQDDIFIGKAPIQKDLEIYHSSLLCPAQCTGNLKHGALVGLVCRRSPCFS